MSLKYDIEVEVSGKEHQGKTTLVPICRSF